MIRAYGLAAALICYARDAAACLRSLAGNGRPASLDEHFASVPRDPEPTPAPTSGPVYDLLVRAKAALRDADFGSEDFAEWGRELMFEDER